MDIRRTYSFIYRFIIIHFPRLILLQIQMTICTEHQEWNFLDIMVTKERVTYQIPSCLGFEEYYQRLNDFLYGRRCVPCCFFQRCFWSYAGYLPRVATALPVVWFSWTAGGYCSFQRCVVFCGLQVSTARSNGVAKYVPQVAIMCSSGLCWWVPQVATMCSSVNDVFRVFFCQINYIDVVTQAFGRDDKLLIYNRMASNHWWSGMVNWRLTLGCEPIKIWWSFK